MNSEHVVVQALLRGWPFPRGAGRIIDRFFCNLKFASAEATVRTTDGFDITVPPNDLIGRHIYLTGEFDRTIVEVLLLHSNPGDVLLDIGANIGYISGCFLAKVPQSKAICVDPQTGILSFLKSNMAQFGIRASVHEIALSSQSGAAFLSIPDGTITRLRPTRGISVTLERSKEFFSKLERLDIIKIDVEGHEAEIFNDAADELQRLRPRAIVFEDATAEAHPKGAIGKVLTECGYEIRAIRKRLTSLDFPLVNEKSDCIANDYLAILNQTSTESHI